MKPSKCPAKEKNETRKAKEEKKRERKQKVKTAFCAFPNFTSEDFAFGSEGRKRLCGKVLGLYSQTVTRKRIDKCFSAKWVWGGRF